MNIVMITQDKSACCDLRAKLPAIALSKLGHKVNIVDDIYSDIFEANVVVFFRGYKNDFNEIVSLLKNRKIKVIYDLDDAITLIPKSSHCYADSQAVKSSVINLLQICDVITVTTPELAIWAKRYNKNVKILPNCLDVSQFEPRKPTGDLRIGYSGSVTHFVDVLILLKAVAELQKKYSFKFVLQGFTYETSLEEIIKVKLAMYGKNGIDKIPMLKHLYRVVNFLKHMNYEFVPFTTFTQHPQLISKLNLDIGLAPLEKTRFNRYKSCVKYYGYALAKTATIASDVLPYNNEVSYLAKNTHQDWYEKIENLICNQELRSHLTEEQHEWVIKNRDINKCVGKWEEAYDRP